MNSSTIIENMLFSFILLVTCNILLSFHILDAWVSFISSWGMLSSFDIVTMFFKYQRSLDIALRTTPKSIPFISNVFQLLHFSLQVYMKRITEVTMICIAPTVLFTLKGNTMLLLKV